MGKFLNCKSGFTLAEVLVTLGIIGVVSAMTIPTLMQNHQKKVYVTELHKVYNEFQQAALAQITSRNAINLTEAGVRSDAAMGTFIRNQFKVVKDCTGDPTDCLADSYTNMDGGTATTYSDTSAPCFALASGAVFCAKYGLGAKTGGLIDSNLTYNIIGNLIVDTNGKSGPNVIGRDLFIMGIYPDGTLSYASNLGQLQQQPNPGGSTGSLHPIDTASTLKKCQRATLVKTNSDASYCFDVILDNNWEMNY